MIIVVPAATAVAVALLTSATSGIDEVQVTDVVKSCVELSENVPVAVYCWEEPVARLEVAGCTSINTSAAGFTVRITESERFPATAVITVAPVVSEVASPLNPDALLTAATAGVDDSQLTNVVTSCIDVSE